MSRVSRKFFPLPAFKMSATPGAAAAAIATAAVARELCGFFNAEDRFCDSGDTF
jgi:hypothetical protein